jgi:hypothetical protein
MQTNEFCFSIEAADAARPCCYSGDIVSRGENARTQNFAERNEAAV